MKVPFAIPFGPVDLVLSMRRAVRVSNNRKRRKLHTSPRHDLSLSSVTVAAPQPPQENIGPEFSQDVAVIVGAGPGFGHGLARHLSRLGMRVALSSRNAERHDRVVAELRALNPWVRAYGCDATSEGSVADLMEHVALDLGEPTLVVYAVQEGGRSGFLDTDPIALEHAWRANCLGGFIVAREAASRMQRVGHGTIVLMGATSGLIGRAGYINFAPGKFGLRAISQVAARELGPLGIHVVHVIVDADIREDELGSSNEVQMEPSDIAETIYRLHRQGRSAWTQELDARPFAERFWEHC